MIMLLPSNTVQAKWGVKVTANMRKLYPGYTPQLHTEDSWNFNERLFDPNSEINVDIPSEWEEKGEPSSKRRHEQRQRGINQAILSHLWVIKDILSSISGTLHMLEPDSFCCSFPPSFPFLDALFGQSLAISSPRKSSLIQGVCYTSLLTASIAPWTSSNQTLLFCFGIVCYLSPQWSYKVHKVATLSFFLVYPKTNTLLGSH